MSFRISLLIEGNRFLLLCFVFYVIVLLITLFNNYIELLYLCTFDTLSIIGLY